MVPQKEISLTRFAPKCDQFSGTKVEIKESEWTVTPEGQTVVPPQQEHKKRRRTRNLLKYLKKAVIEREKPDIVQSVTNAKSSLEPTQT